LGFLKNIIEFVNKNFHNSSFAFFKIFFNVNGKAIVSGTRDIMAKCCYWEHLLRNTLGTLLTFWEPEVNILGTTTPPPSPPSPECQLNCLIKNDQVVSCIPFHFNEIQISLHSSYMWPIIMFLNFREIHSFNNTFN